MAIARPRRSTFIGPRARTVPGIGTVVGLADPPSRTPPRRRRGTTPLSRGLIVAVALQIADGEGLCALSMRRVAAHLDVTTMALYRHGAPALASDTAGHAFPHLARVPPNSLDLGTLFEFGLQLLLDGIGKLIDA